MMTGRFLAVVVSFVLIASCGSDQDPNVLARVRAEQTSSAEPTASVDASAVPKATSSPSPSPVSRPRGTWRAVASAPDGVPSRGASAWTGDELIVCCGSGGAGAYRPASDSWRLLPDPPVDWPGTAVWTGTEVIFWGGSARREGFDLSDATDTGAAYTPSTDTWRQLVPAPLARTGHEAAWTGSEMLVWGGVERCCSVDSTIHGAEAMAYDPATDAWRRLADVPAPWSGDDGPAVSLMDAGRLLVWRQGSLGAYDIADDTWVEVSRPELPSDECMLSNGPHSSAALVGGTIHVWTAGCGPTYGSAYDLRRRSWTRTADVDPAVISLNLAAGRDEIYGHSLLSVVRSGGSETSDVSAYSISRDEWNSLSPPDFVRLGAIMVWTGKELLLWGGWDDRESPTGAIYTPAS